MTKELTSEQSQILSMLCEGHITQEVGEQMNYCTASIQHRIATLLRKFNCRTRTELAYLYGKGKVR